MTVAKGAALAGVPFYLSSVTDSGLEAVAAAASGPRVFQLYVRGEFVGGSDIMMEMYESGELAQMLEKPAAA